MARRNSSNLGILVALVVCAAVAGGIFFVRGMGNDTPHTNRPEKTDGYDDSYGRLDTAVGYAEFTHILIGWKGLKGTTPKDPNRTKQEARKLVDRLWQEYKDDPSEEHWRELQEKYNDDSVAPHFLYKTEGGPPLAPQMVRCAETTAIGYARIVETPYGFHLMRRER